MTNEHLKARLYFAATAIASTAVTVYALAAPFSSSH